MPAVAERPSKTKSKNKPQRPSVKIKDERRVNKVHVYLDNAGNVDRVQINYEHPTEVAHADGQNNGAPVQKWDKFTIECKEPPKPSLDRALNGLLEFVPELCEFPDLMGDWWAQPHGSVRGLSISYGDKGLAATFHVCRKLAKGPPINLQTPLRKELAAKNDKGESIGLSPECVEQIQRVASQALKYVDGDRAQLVLQDAKKNASGKDKEQMTLAQA